MVYWRGGEQVALWSIALRDSFGELVLGTDDNYRQGIGDEAAATLRDGSGNLRPGVVRFGVRAFPPKAGTTSRATTKTFEDENSVQLDNDLIHGQDRSIDGRSTPPR